MAPEYALRGQLTEKADVFSFGVLLLEIISGRKNRSSSEDMEFLIEGVWFLSMSSFESQFSRFFIVWHPLLTKVFMLLLILMKQTWRLYTTDRAVWHPLLTKVFMLLLILMKQTWRLYTTDRALEIMDPALEGSYSSEEGIRLIKIGLLCTQATAALRPSMFRVVAMLTSETEHLPSPTQPAFVDLDNAGGPHKLKRGKVNDEDKTSRSTATSSSTPSAIHSVAADPTSGTLEPR